MGACVSGAQEPGLVEEVPVQEPGLVEEVPVQEPGLGEEVPVQEPGLGLVEVPFYFAFIPGVIHAVFHVLSLWVKRLNWCSSFYYDYQNRKNEYVENFWQVCVQLTSEKSQYQNALYG